MYTRLKRNAAVRIFPLSFPFNAKTLISIISDQISRKLKCGVDENMCHVHEQETSVQSVNIFGDGFSMILSKISNILSIISLCETSNEFINAFCNCSQDH